MRRKWEILMSIIVCISTILFTIGVILLECLSDSSLSLLFLIMLVAGTIGIVAPLIFLYFYNDIKTKKEKKD